MPTIAAEGITYISSVLLPNRYILALVISHLTPFIDLIIPPCRVRNLDGMTGLDWYSFTRCSFPCKHRKRLAVIVGLLVVDKRSATASR